jgi:hypothetical protein
VGTFLPDSNDFVTGSPEGLALYDGRTGRKRATLAHPGGCDGPPRVHPKGTLVVTCKGELFVRGAPGEPLRALEGASGLDALTFSNDGSALAGWSTARGNKGRVTVWDLASGRRVITLDDPDNPITAAAWSPSAPILLIGTRHGAWLARAIDGDLLRLRSYRVGADRKMAWIAHTRHGLFQGDAAAAAQVVVQIGEDPRVSPRVTLDAVAARLRRDDLIATFMAGRPIEAPGAIPVLSLKRPEHP